MGVGVAAGPEEVGLEAAFLLPQPTDIQAVVMKRNNKRNHRINTSDIFFERRASIPTALSPKFMRFVIRKSKALDFGGRI
jgi:hypothetical protein